MRYWTVVLLVEHTTLGWRVMLQEKKPGCKCAGHVAPPGGKYDVQKDSSLFACSAREASEESNVTLFEEHTRNAGVIIHFDGDEPAGYCYIHVATRWRGLPEETDVMGPPQWFTAAELSTATLVHPRDAEWIIPVASGGCVEAHRINCQEMEVESLTLEEFQARQRACRYRFPG